MQQLFVYGSLLFSELVKALTGAAFSTKEGVLPDFKRFAVNGADYPAVVSLKGDSVKGKILLNVDDRSMEILRFYEGDEYECISAFIHTENETTKALVFVWKGDKARLNGRWDENHFKATSLETYISEVAPATRTEFDTLST